MSWGYTVWALKKNHQNSGNKHQIGLSITHLCCILIIYEDLRYIKIFLFLRDWFQTKMRNLSTIYNYFLLTYHYNDLEKSLAAWSNMRCKILKKGCNSNSIRKREIALRWFRDVFKIYELKMRSTLNLFQMHILKEYTEML